MVVLDTNVLSELVRTRPNPAIAERVLSASKGSLYASEMTRYELRFGALLHPAPQRLWARIQALVLTVPNWVPVSAAISDRAAPTWWTRSSPPPRWNCACRWSRTTSATLKPSTASWSKTGSLNLDARPGRYQVVVKVIDIFGNDTMTLVPVNVG
jgi:hypothetical protein